jgi:glycosyltransferase involved in cell wall biosynthesis/peptidoglycan/xylan/chitin deacetylase (PgdA/CDA1 family)
MKLSVVINTYNRRRALKRTLPSLLSQDFPADDCEIVVVVDGSTDGTLEFLHSVQSPFPFRVLSQSNLGPAAARNSGWQAARGEIVLFLDDDIISTPGLLQKHCAAHIGEDALLVHGPISIAPDSPKTLIRYATEIWYESYYGSLSPSHGLSLPKDVYLLSNSSLPRRILEKCEGLDERAPGYEDFELGLRLWKTGVRFLFLPSAGACEFFVKRSGEFLRKQVKRWARADLYNCRKHPEYRPYSRLTAMGGTAGWKHKAKEWAARLPVSPLGLFRIPLWMAERLYSIPAVRNGGVRLLAIATELAFLRFARLGIGSWRALQREFRMRLPILLYHHVGPIGGDTNPELTVSPERFEAQVRCLARRGYQGIRLSDWLAWVRTGRPLPEKPVLLTFDDAYADIARYALPVLERYGFGAAVFVITGRVGGTISWGKSKGLFQLMSAEQIREWAGRGIEFGAHSRTHPDLTTLDPAALRDEVVGSKRDLEDILQAPVISFAYPYGPYNPAVCECVRGMYDLAFTTDEGLNDLRTDLHVLRRTGVSPDDSIVDLSSRLRWGLSPLQRLRGRVRFRTRMRNAARSVFARSL